MVNAIKPSPKAKKRSLGLSIWLVLLMLGAGFSALVNLFSLFSTSYTLVPDWAYLSLGLLAVANLVFLFYVWTWNLWAFKALVATTVLVFIINIAIGVSFFASLLGFLGVGILYVLMRPLWDWFK